MSVTIVTRWSTPDVAAAMDVIKRAKAVWMKHGAEAFRANQVYTGEFTGQLLIALVFPDLATYATAQVKAAADMQPLFAETARLGGVLHERVILMGLDV
jgi:hypothetical protein